MAKTIQTHHIIYGSDKHPEQEWTEDVFKAEHMLLSRMRWYTKKDVSQGFLKDLIFFAIRNWDRAVNLSIDGSDKQEIK